MRSSVYSLLIAILTVNMFNAQGGGSVYCGKLTENFNACNANGATAPTATQCTGDCPNGASSCAFNQQNQEIRVWSPWDGKYYFFQSLPVGDPNRRPFDRLTVECIMYIPCTAPCTQYTKPDNTQGYKCAPDFGSKSVTGTFYRYSQNGLLCADEGDGGPT